MFNDNHYANAVLTRSERKGETMSDKVQGNEFVINPSRLQYDYNREYWREVAWKHAKARNRGTVIVVDDVVVYRAWPERESVYKGIADE